MTALYLLARLAAPVTLAPPPPAVAPVAPDTASALRAWAWRWLENRKRVVELDD